MEISKIIIHNFQVIKHLEIDLVDGINTFIGSTNSGKSACIRAILWVINNEFMECHWGEKECFVELHFADGNIVKRYKTPSKNAYYLNGIEFTALGRSGVPDEVARVININEINIKEQDDPYYLIACSAGERARVFNKIMHLDKIERANKIINQKARKISTQIDALNIVVADKTTELSKLANLSNVEPLFNELGDISRKIDKIDSERSKLIECISKLQDSKATLIQYKELSKIKTLLEQYKQQLYTQNKILENIEILEKIRNVYKTQDKYKNIKEVEKLYKQLKEKQAEFIIVENKQKELKTTIKQLVICENRQKIDINKLEKLVSSLKVCYNKQETIKSNVQRFKELKGNVRRIKCQLDELKEQKEKIMKEKEVYLCENPTCPTCGKKW